ncbi:hypothetical protein PHIN3_178 [Sinorhizobium phage phiN3]|uniref:Uncharacterized protein n=1 Tax=Sinorhizobium phage phiN3 TaxID=1647405 RepID=A0A0F6YQ24_9CAUD|nr:hypothetical protein AVT40_gp355 [Sinorhizobium phage phiN3]AKF13441.1 hypothetical protein PHIN3_178 [Sinorhizobium phage phiN3]
MASKKTGNYPIPFDTNGNQLHYPETWTRDGVVMKDNFVFADVLTFSHFSRGRSAAYAYFKRSTGETVTVFLSDLADIMKIMVRGEVGGTFTFCKKGMNYGTKLVG